MIVKADEYCDYYKLDRDTAGTALEMVLRAAQRACEQFCGGRKFEAGDHVEYHDIAEPGVGTLQVRNPPIISVTTLTDDAQATDGGDTITSSDYVLDSEAGLLTLDQDETYFTRGVQAAYISYRGGYEPDEIRDERPELWMAVMLTAGVIWNDPDALLVESETADGVSVTAHKTVVPPAARDLLSGYRRVL